jgi:hypothetical protein
MSLAEVLWRTHGAWRASWDAVRVGRGFRPSGRIRIDLQPFRETKLFPWPVGGAKNFPWCAGLVDAAERVSRNRLSFFDLDDVHLGDPIDWHRDHASRRAAPLVVSHRIDYRDFAAVGDCKLVWEPNRHHQLVVLARAYRATGEERFALTLLRQLESWLDANPFGRGMNWRSPLELGIRLITWSCALDLIAPCLDAETPLLSRVADSIYDHSWQIARNYSRGSSANNHLIGEAAGVFVANSLYSSLPDAARRRDEAARLLESEIERQTYPDGCTREHAFGYHLFVAQFFLVCKRVAECTGQRFSAAYDERLERMIDFAVSMMEASRSLPKLGDSDDGYVLDLGEPVDDYDSWLAIGCRLFARADLAARLERAPQTAYWLFGPEGTDAVERQRSAAPPGAELSSKAYRDSGYCLLQCGSPSVGDQVSVLFDCAELGYGSIAAHGHADALSVVVRAYGRDLLVDAGTYDYFSYPEWRSYFRSTAAHNTVRIDGRDQSVMLGPFLWGRRARAELVRFASDGRKTLAQGRHDGYAKLPAAVHHSRTVVLDAEARVVSLVDELEGEGEHDVELFFHLAPGSVATQIADGAWAIRIGGHTARLELDPALAGSVHAAREGEPAGWVSDAYHRKAASVVIHGRARLRCPATLRSAIRLPRETGRAAT